ncbi:unnamed protein product [Medioppia subpectinata]|uniref:Uncharacterized protein n=1 Tax=Medioppia subpectinata TaxID=1979941 RepID=A0A7R9QES2_9ACAR|nr:unnamed protein product [Medioppia subpectinata]CAG2118749.1 unnamed protein product [Medioppia subpectinata]
MRRCSSKRSLPKRSCTQVVE